MKQIIFLPSLILFSLSGIFLFLYPFLRSHQTLAYAVGKCTPIGKVEQVTGEGFQINGDYKETLIPGSLLCAERSLESTASSEITLRCLSNNELQPLLSGVTINNTSVCALAVLCGETTKDPNCSSRGGTEIVSQMIPKIITPRDTALLNPQPRLAWQSVAGATTYTVTIEEKIEGMIWEKVTDKTELIYDGNSPLKPGHDYTLIVQANIGDQTKADFSILDQESALKIKSYGETTQNASTIIPPIFSLYKEFSLIAEAIEILENLEKQNSQLPVVYQELGDLYLQIGLIDTAEKAYSKGVRLASQVQNLQSEALQQARLGEVSLRLKKSDEARQRIMKAQELYRQAGELELANQLEELKLLIN